MINAYLNDCSAQSQFHGWDEMAALREFVELADRASADSSVCVDVKNVFKAMLSPEHRIPTLLKQDRDLSTKFYSLVNSALNTSCNTDASYEVNKESYTGRIIGCAYDTTDQPLLINLPNSSFGTGCAVNVTKNGQNIRMIDQIDSIAGWTKYLKSNLVVAPYRADAKRPPMDEQTILVDADLFEPTGRREQGRIRYRRKENGEIWYVDNAHYGLSAHLEVFDANGVHIGKCKIDDIKTFINKPTPGRTISI